MLALKRCPWAQQQLQEFHDTEWAVPVTTEAQLFQLLCLQVWQSGLNRTVLLRKRAALNQTFHAFSAAWLRQTNPALLFATLADPALIRNQRKLVATQRNAFALERLQQQGQTLRQLLWRQSKVTQFTTTTAIPRYDEGAMAVAAQLKAAGFQFMGPTNCYALLANAGVLNLHLTTCWRYPHIEQARQQAQQLINGAV
ncbi:DNA-3-methyladenine glycosylase I [Loigolactobacillus binensis]|uniref:DNA-3-methyladenine glycosylase I n=1 Tax=Loigolactobacillus binensis TaxID=2559922 RepID=A0ABW3EFI1_9LACO|nr:DNA-3-methyladenine glycosylase I [Loigolactobacillus binensis]